MYTLIIEQARYIARTYGRYLSRYDHMERVACHIKESTATKTYLSDKFRITVGMDTLEMSITKIENDNPVVVSNAHGEIYRYHGEIEHIAQDILDIFLDQI